MPARKKRKSYFEQTELEIKVTGFQASVTVAINYELSNLRYMLPNTNVYRFVSRLQLDGLCTYPEKSLKYQYPAWFFVVYECLRKWCPGEDFRKSYSYLYLLSFREILKIKMLLKMYRKRF